MHGLFKWSSKWWPGLVPLVVFWAIAAWTSTAPLEADLASRSGDALKGALLDKLQIEVFGRDVTLAADAFSEDGRHLAVAAVEAVPGVRLVNDETRLVPEARPFVWSAERDVVRVTLGGSAPLPATKGRLLDAARADLGEGLDDGARVDHAARADHGAFHYDGPRKHGGAGVGVQVVREPVVPGRGGIAVDPDRQLVVLADQLRV